ncbi:MAG TPA: xylulokinase [Steroidobacteraceae bacterium]|nr:xylulokinase [Steroidobacteraceae bacterium]
MFLGIDIGTSSVKAALIGPDRELLAQGSAPLTVSRPRPGFSEQDPEAWWQAVQAAVGQLPAQLRSQVRALGLSGQMHGATLLDAAGKVLRPAMLWNDGRSAAECRELERREPRARAITGNIVMPGFTAPKLLWVRHHEPELFERTATVLLPKDYVRWRLTGAKISDLSDASGTAWLDVGRRDWSDAMLAATGLSRSQMPLLVEGSAPGGMLTPEAMRLLGLPRVIVAGGGGDNAAGAVGAGVVRPGQAFLSLGTSGVLFVVTDRFRPNPDRAAHAFCHCLPGRWHQMAVLLSAASALDWVLSVTGGGDAVALVEQARRPDLGGAPLFLPYLSGERTPHNDPDARGVFFGLNPGTSRADLVQAVLEGVALAFADGLEVLLEGGGSIDEIDVTGGGARFAWWGELLAAALNRPLVYRRGGEVSAAAGAAVLARMALTGEPAQELCLPAPVLRVVEPDPSLARQLARRRDLFARVYRDLKPSFLELAR